MLRRFEAFMPWTWHGDALDRLLLPSGVSEGRARSECDVLYRVQLASMEGHLAGWLAGWLAGLLPLFAAPYPLWGNCEFVEL
jgi:hypothetical protein